MTNSLEMVNLSASSITQIGLLLVLICWTNGSTGAAFSLEEEFLQLKETYVRTTSFRFHTSKLSAIRIQFGILYYVAFCSFHFDKRFK